MRRHISPTTVLAAMLAAAVGWVVGRQMRPATELAEELWRQADPDAPSTASEPHDDSRRVVQAKADQVAASRRGGSPEDRAEAPRPSVGLDVQRLQSMKNSLEPIVQYLTYIQSRRGDDSALLFIRYDDIDAMAELDGEPSTELMERLDQLGVVVSAN